MTGQRICPLRLRLGLRPKPRMTPTLEDRLSHTTLQCGSYEKASLMAAKWGTAVASTTIHRTARGAGRRAEQATAARVCKVMNDDTPQRPKSPDKAAPFSLILMMDGWMIRERGTQWGLKPPEKEASRVEWREVKSAVLFRVEDQARKGSGRGMLVKKFVVTWRGDPIEFGRRLYAEASRRGLEQAGKLFVVADGGVWIWNLAAEHFSQAQGVLDFYHAAEHLHAAAHAIHDDPAAARAWLEPLMHQLKHGGEAGVLRKLEDLIELARRLDAENAETVRREVKYFQTHRDHLHYEKVQEEGCPAGSGAMESLCAQMQGRFKRPGQFWSAEGERDLLALDQAHRNADWDELWEPS